MLSQERRNLCRSWEFDQQTVIIIIIHPQTGTFDCQIYDQCESRIYTWGDNNKNKRKYDLIWLIDFEPTKGSFWSKLLYKKPIPNINLDLQRFSLCIFQMCSLTGTEFKDNFISIKHSLTGWITLLLWEVLTWVCMIRIVLNNNLLFHLARSPYWYRKLSHSSSLWEHSKVCWFLNDEAFRLHSGSFGRTLGRWVCPGAQGCTRFEFCLREVGDICHDTKFIYFWIGDFFWCNNLWWCKD